MVKGRKWKLFDVSSPFLVHLCMRELSRGKEIVVYFTRHPSPLQVVSGGRQPWGRLRKRLPERAVRARRILGADRELGRRRAGSRALSACMDSRSATA